MSLTYGQLKSSLRGIMWPAGEQYTLQTAHDKAFLDSLIDIQTYVECLQQDNVDQFPHCATYYQCGLTVFPAPYGNIKKVVAVEKLDAESLPDADGEENWCGEVEYTQVNPTYIREYLINSRTLGCCLPAYLYFGLPSGLCRKTVYPVPTDEGLPPGLPTLPLGYHYPQVSTDASARALAGVWAIERGRIYIAPWIQSTEKVIVTWDGIKRSWGDSDPISDNPLVSRAVKAWVLREHAKDWDHDYDAMNVYGAEYDAALRELIHECREVTRVRGKEPSYAMEVSGSGASTLYYNDAQTATANCPDGTSGNPVTVTIPANTVGSALSKADANKMAYDQALAQATAQLVCDDVTPEYCNDEQEYTAHCADLSEADAPMPTGADSYAKVAAGTVCRASKGQANADALAQATAEAIAGLTGCTFYNRKKTGTATCPNDANNVHTVTVEAGTETGSSQAEADLKAQAKADRLAAEELAADLTCNTSLYWNTPGFVMSDLWQNCWNRGNQRDPPCSNLNPCCTLEVRVTYPAHTDSSHTSQADANAAAQQHWKSVAENLAGPLCLGGICGIRTYTVQPGSDWPTPD